MHCQLLGQRLQILTLEPYLRPVLCVRGARGPGTGPLNGQCTGPQKDRTDALPSEGLRPDHPWSGTRLLWPVAYVSTASSPRTPHLLHNQHSPGLEAAVHKSTVARSARMQDVATKL